jgi:hypothetical protein
MRKIERNLTHGQTDSLRRHADTLRWEYRRRFVARVENLLAVEERVEDGDLQLAINIVMRRMPKR